ncbi:MAG: Mov34/MPN/PAD-1 family protein [Lachnospiraceae bacterium]|nr:Mov34/MPN/PAD-1 family protein [Lachnospiraceae bacterium]
MIILTKGKTIKICEDVLSTLYKYRQIEQTSCEAGGVLIGRENLDNDNLIIEYVTVPMRNDRRTRTRFFREDKGHIDYYSKLFENYGGIYLYVGEWHTHPEEYPQYSIVDICNWRRISKTLPKNVKQFHVIVGNKALRVWEFSRGFSGAKEIATYDWRDDIYDK